MCSSDLNYYLIANDDFDSRMKHYRVDKMKKISTIEEEREGKEQYSDLDLAAYSKMNFGMYSGKITKVHIRFPNEMCGVFIDRFGKGISFVPVCDEISEFAVDVAISPQFYGWLFSLGKNVKVTGPNHVVEELRKFAEGIIGNYV